MESIYKKFYKAFYMKTGFIPANILSVFPGDLVQIRNKEIILLGNIYRNGIVDPEEAAIEKNLGYNASNWSFNSGVSKSYSGRGTGNNLIEGEFEYSKQTLSFSDMGSFIFKANNPEGIKISNWQAIKDALIIKLTQTLYSFRDVYVVTEIASTSDWTLAIAGAPEAELDLATESENFGLVDIFGKESTKTIQSKDIEFYHKESRRLPNFFKAKKLTVSDDKMEAFITDYVKSNDDEKEWLHTFFDSNLEFNPIALASRHSNMLQINLLDMLSSNQLNPNTALSYFNWANADLNDIERLFS